MLIKMKELSTGASCNRDAEKLAKEIEKALTKKEKIIIDFEGIERYATLFFNFSLLPYARQFGKQKYDETFTILNLSDFGQKVYNCFYKNSIKHPIKFTTEQEKLIVKIVDEISELD